MGSADTTSSAAEPQQLPADAKLYLTQLLLKLRDIEGTVVVAAHALRAEEGWVGMCTSRVLRTQVSDLLSAEIRRARDLFLLDLPTHLELEG